MKKTTPSIDSSQYKNSGLAESSQGDGGYGIAKEVKTDHHYIYNLINEYFIRENLKKDKPSITSDLLEALQNCSKDSKDFFEYVINQKASALESTLESALESTLESTFKKNLLIGVGINHKAKTTKTSTEEQASILGRNEPTSQITKIFENLGEHKNSDLTFMELTYLFTKNPPDIVDIINEKFQEYEKKAATFIDSNPLKLAFNELSKKWHIHSKNKPQAIKPIKSEPVAQKKQKNKNP